MNWLNWLTGEEKPKSRKGRKPYRPHRITVQKPFCTPCRERVLTVLYDGRYPDGDKKYGVPFFNYRETVTTASLKDAAKLLKIEFRDNENFAKGYLLPMASQASFDVPKQQANWAEYLLERAGLAVVRGGVNRRNRRNADKYNRKLPPRWDGTRPWIERGCKEGLDQWSEFVKQAKGDFV